MNGSNYSIIQKDVYNMIDKKSPEFFDKIAKQNGNEISQEARDRIISYIKNGGISVKLSKSEMAIYDKLKTEFDNILSQTGTAKFTEVIEKNVLIRGGISDIYGGVTNTLIQGSSGHGNTYWFNQKTGERTDKQESEMFAHYFAYGIIGDEEAVEDMKEFLPETMDRYDQMANDMIRAGGGNE